MNLLNGVCSTAGRCSISTSSGSVSTTAATASTTDLNLNNNNGASVNAGKAWFQILLPASTSLAAVSLKLAVGAAGATVYGVTEANALVSIGTYSSSYTFANLDADGTTVFKAVRIESSAGFSVFEIAARSKVCSEFAMVDYGSVQTISALTVRHYAGGTAGNVAATYYEYSSDKATWQSVPVSGGIPPMLVGSLDVPLSPPIQARYVRVRHELKEKTSANVFVWEISAWGADGKYGKVSSGWRNEVNFRDLLGVNGIWSWGGQGWSNLALPGWGPNRVSPVASHARNYHNWKWDVADPDNVPNFEKMACGGGTESQWWLSWDWEYAGWNGAGLEVEASIQFTPSDMPKKVFNDPYRAGYNYGYVFAKHFGRNGGTGLVSSLEVGNEPWTYDASLYSQILLGMAQGVKDADPTMLVLPAAFGSLSDLFARMNAQHLLYLDALNVHAYSWLQTAQGNSGVYPEHPMSTLHSVNGLLRFRDAVLPTLPVYLTEWGWDSAGGGEDCQPPADRAGQAVSPQCVSESAQAAYAVRGALMLARKGLARLTWYFYGNTVMTTQTWDASKALFARSGLTSSSAAGFKNKKSLYALEVFVSTLGGSHFQQVLREDEQAYVYVLGDKDGKATHVVMWRPVDAEDKSTATVSVDMSLVSGVSSGGALSASKAWVLGEATYVSASLPTVSGSVWTSDISSLPTVVELGLSN